MHQLSGVNILIVDNDPPSSSDLRIKLTRNGASVRVISSFKAAALMVQRNRIDVAFVPFEHHDQTGDLRAILEARGIPQIITGSPPARYPRWSAEREVFLALQ
jgi:hypothetical protein